MIKKDKTKTPAKDALRVLFCTPEVTPFSGTGGLGEVSGSLPAALNRLTEKNIDCRVISPLYGSISQEYRKDMEFLGYKDIPVSWRSKYMGVFSLRRGGVTYYFIDNEEYFKRDGQYGFYDDCERYAFFSRAVFESIDFTGFIPDIIHANDWQTALVPVYQDAIYHRRFLSTIFTIHNIEYQGYYGTEVIGDVIGLPAGADHLLEFNGGANLIKGGIDTANIVTTVSPTYADELSYPFFAYGLDGIVNSAKHKMTGILNGIDVKTYDPEHDKMIAATYSAADISGKSTCKKSMLREAGLPDDGAPLVSMISRLVPAKGIDLVRGTIEGMLSQADFKLIVLGTGNQEYEDFFRYLESKYPDKVRAFITFNSQLSHKLYSASDIFLMPSKTEPCGLSQMIAMRYGTVPVVRATGGLRDSVSDCTMGEGTGFVFENYDMSSFADALSRAISLYGNKKSWEALVRYDLKQDFSWNRSALEYMKLYERAAQK
ncbi:MAG: glycogen/starch synthase [Anaerovoracaceae bacterium]|nr:glycogen/starch synthase [Bacillota bacterium]MDY2671337.1 glycogen/starch synthase [Anaerovoracaceae bacterium]